MFQVPYNQPYSNALEDMSNCLANNKYEGGEFSIKVTEMLKQITSCENILLTSSCTAALEMSALLIDIQPGDEVIMPSFTFVSTANAFALRGAKLVFIDISSSTLNINEDLIEDYITPKTKAIVVVHYAGVSCNMKKITAIAEKYNLSLIEDAAQCIDARHENKHLGTNGSLGCLSFHYTKNLIAGFGGALLINDANLYNRAKIILQRGTNRDAFLEGQVDKYSWVDLGSSYVMNELSAALLFSQLKHVDKITKRRCEIWKKYHEGFEALEKEEIVMRPCLENDSHHNGHIYYLILNSQISRKEVIGLAAANGIQLTSHYQPLHNSIYYAEKFGYRPLPVTEMIAAQIIRFPIYYDLDEAKINYVIDHFKEIIFNQSLITYKK